MLCERCQTNRATIQVTLVVGESDSAHHFCEVCYPTAAPNASTGKAGWVSQERPPRPLPTREEISRITTDEYFEAMARANANAADKPVFKHICAELRSLPETQQRLAFEFLRRLWCVLQSQSDPWTPFAFWPPSWTRAITPDRLPEYLGWLDKISLRCFELLGPLGEPFGLRVHLQMALTAIYTVDRERFRSILKSLQGQCSAGENDQRRAILAEIEQLMTRPGSPPST